MATVALVDVNYNSSGDNRFRIDFTVAFSGLTTSDFEVNAGINSSFATDYVSGNSQYLTFRHGAHSGEAGYIRFKLPADALTPHLSEDLDWTIYWGTDGVLHHGATDAVRASRATSLLNTVRWVNATGTAGQTRAVELQFDRAIWGLEASDTVLGGDITSLASFAHHGTYQTYRFNVTLPSDLGEGGSFTFQIPARESVYPGMNVSEEWTLSWDSSGNLSAVRSNEIPAELTIVLSTTGSIDNTSDLFKNNQLIYAIFSFSKDVSGFTRDDVTVTDGVIKSSLLQISPRHYVLYTRAPVSGRGQGVVSVPEDAVFPGNNAVTRVFDYVDQVDVDLSLSAASAENGQTVVARFDFDYRILNLMADQVKVGSRVSRLLSYNGKILTINGKALGFPSENNAVVGTPVALDDDNRSWVVPIELPQVGQGMLDIELPQDAIGFQQAPVRAQVQFAPTITLNISLPPYSNAPNITTLSLLPVISKDFSHDINITGNNISSVDVQGLLRPFYHVWNSTTGVLSIKGKPTSYYKDLEFEVIATDANGTSRKTAKLTVIEVAPAIIKPHSTLRVAAGVENSLEVLINNNPRKVEIEGSWVGLDHSISERGVRIFGEVPASGLGISQGNLIVDAENSGGQAKQSLIPWKISTPIIGDFDLISYNLPSHSTFYVAEVGDTFNKYLSDFTQSVPAPTFEPYDIGGAMPRPFNLPPGIIFNGETSNLSGTFTTEGNYWTAFTMRNSQGAKIITTGFSIKASGSICTAYGFLDHSLKEDCATLTISLKGVSNGKTKKVHA